MYFMFNVIMKHIRLGSNMECFMHECFTHCVECYLCMSGMCVCVLCAECMSGVPDAWVWCEHASVCVCVCMQVCLMHEWCMNVFLHECVHASASCMPGFSYLNHSISDSVHPPSLHFSLEWLASLPMKCSNGEWKWWQSASQGCWSAGALWSTSQRVTHYPMRT